MMGNLFLPRKPLPGVAPFTAKGDKLWACVFCSRNTFTRRGLTGTIVALHKSLLSPSRERIGQPRYGGVFLFVRRQ
jgi:hypothetical protein